MLNNGNAKVFRGIKFCGLRRETADSEFKLLCSRASADLMSAVESIKTFLVDEFFIRKQKFFFAKTHESIDVEIRFNWRARMFFHAVEDMQIKYIIIVTKST